MNVCMHEPSIYGVVYARLDGLVCVRVRLKVGGDSVGLLARPHVSLSALLVRSFEILLRLGRHVEALSVLLVQCLLAGWRKGCSVSSGVRALMVDIDVGVVVVDHDNLTAAGKVRWV